MYRAAPAANAVSSNSPSNHAPILKILPIPISIYVLQLWPAPTVDHSRFFSVCEGNSPNWRR